VYAAVSGNSSSVVVRHLPEQSDLQSGQHAFAYTVTIRNSGDITAQLIARHWIVSDSNGHTEEVRGLAWAIGEGQRFSFPGSEKCTA
jgi:uncharacterized protein affecting Mg2+/Co2+ transport